MLKRQKVDYHGFRLSRINEPRFRHLWLLGTWLIYFALYFLTENLIPAERCHVMHCFLDDLLPFNEYFLIFYTGWYLLVFGSVAYYLMYDVKRFRELDLYIFVTQMVAMFFYIFFPSRQDLRPETFPRENFFTWVMGLIYAFDTSTGVCPSLHVAYSMGIASAWLKEKDVRKWFKAFILVSVALICLATMFIKQHSAVDFFVALPVCLLAEGIAYGKSYWAARREMRRAAHQSRRGR